VVAAGAIRVETVALVVQRADRGDGVHGRTLAHPLDVENTSTAITEVRRSPPYSSPLPAAV
jgi:hypothetical protein